MSTPCYSSMHICMCQHCSAQTHSSPEGDRKLVAFKPVQYKQNIKKLKSAIEPKSLPNIPTSESVFEFLQIIFYKVFLAYYSQFTQSTFSTPTGVNLAAQKPYISSPKPSPTSSWNDYICHSIIKSSISSSGGHPTPAFHIPQDLSTIFQHLQLEPLIKNYICCPQCFFLNDLTESVTTGQSHCQHHNEPNKHDAPFTQSLEKCIN
ncbi:hypothetical protein O181_054924 [Austropuccinia psidii MF-1]|uniref:Uncharacterized protein n=1 Tax=Austropuccinia psidii MF-1 TaxID=1389203 RepID=A0A9Q3E5I8_9BASI|nr:hypothetical protein [Austropuccinia psidii MF-1]